MRPLTATTAGGLYSLVDTAGDEPPSGYMEACQAALEYFNIPPTKPDGRSDPLGYCPRITGLFSRLGGQWGQLDSMFGVGEPCWGRGLPNDD
jgi:hypothetical protein